MYSSQDYVASVVLHKEETYAYLTKIGWNPELHASRSHQRHFVQARKSPLKGSPVHPVLHLKWLYIFTTEMFVSCPLKISPKGDVWSLGCILYCMTYGKTPFQSITNQIAKLQAIIDPSHKIDFPDISEKDLLDVLKVRQEPH